jgi:hypothetical protein
VWGKAKERAKALDKDKVMGKAMGKAMAVVRTKLSPNTSSKS